MNAPQSAASERPLAVIVEDDRDLNNLLKFTLETSGQFSVISSLNGEDGLRAIQLHRPRVVILDVMLPDISGTDVLRDIRRDVALARTPVILLTARSQEQDKIDGFEAGADDYITKPFSPRELLLRVSALLRRSADIAPQQPSQPSLQNRSVLRLGPLEIHPDEFRVLADGQTVSLTVTEFQLLLFLAERAGRLQSREVLLQKVWGYEGNINTRTVDTHIKRLRQKLGVGGMLIETVHGFGYQLSTKPL